MNKTLFSLVAILVSTSAMAAGTKDFMAGVDRQIDTESVSRERLVAERYYRLMSRLSVYALYCDFKNELGYSQSFHELWVRTAELQTFAEKEFGGLKKAYNRFEKLRNEESLRYIQTGTAYCAPSYPAFKSYVAMSGKALKKKLADSPAGDL